VYDSIAVYESQLQSNVWWRFSLNQMQRLSQSCNPTLKVPTKILDSYASQTSFVRTPIINRSPCYPTQNC